MPIVVGFNEYFYGEWPLVNFYNDGTITCHSMTYRNHYCILTDMFKHVNIDFEDVGYGSSYKISIEQEFILKSMLNDGEYSDKVLGRIVNDKDT